MTENTCFAIAVACDVGSPKRSVQSPQRTLGATQRQGSAARVRRRTCLRSFRRPRAGLSRRRSRQSESDAAGVIEGAPAGHDPSPGRRAGRSPDCTGAHRPCRRCRNRRHQQPKAAARGLRSRSLLSERRLINRLIQSSKRSKINYWLRVESILDGRGRHGASTGSSASRRSTEDA